MHTQQDTYFGHMQIHKPLHMRVLRISLALHGLYMLAAAWGGVIVL